jgi:hypothetical protein
VSASPTTEVGAAPTTTTGAAAVTTSAPAITAPPSSDGPSLPAVAEEVNAAFAALAAAAAPMTVFAPTFLPDGAALASEWLPVVDSADPGSYSGPPVANPQAVGSGPESEIQVVFEQGDGWFVVLENFRGDLGDIEGTPVATVGGNPASLYEVNGGELVQWSKDGRWYGVFGRGVSRDDLVSVASGMLPQTPDSR